MPEQFFVGVFLVGVFCKLFFAQKKIKQDTFYCKKKKCFLQHKLLQGSFTGN